MASAAPSHKKLQFLLFNYASSAKFNFRIREYVGESPSFWLWEVPTVKVKELLKQHKFCSREERLINQPGKTG